VTKAFAFAYGQQSECQYGVHADIANECVRGQLTERVKSSSSAGSESKLPSAPVELVSAYGYVSVSVALYDKVKQELHVSYLWTSQMKFIQHVENDRICSVFDSRQDSPHRKYCPQHMVDFVCIGFIQSK
jgi:hypothetical protein